MREVSDEITAARALPPLGFRAESSDQLQSRKVASITENVPKQSNQAEYKKATVANLHTNGGNSACWNTCKKIWQNVNLANLCVESVMSGPTMADHGISMLIITFRFDANKKNGMKLPTPIEVYALVFCLPVLSLICLVVVVVVVVVVLLLPTMGCERAFDS